MEEMKEEDILEKEQEAKDALNQRIHHLTARIIVTSGILPSIRNWKNLHLLSSDSKPTRFFSNNLRWLRNTLPNIIGNIPIKETDWNKMEVMQKERSSEKILNSIIQLLGSVDSNEMQYKLILNLYQERLRENGKYKAKERASRMEAL